MAKSGAVEYRVKVVGIERERQLMTADCMDLAWRQIVFVQ